jgi:arabinogalactan oligomer/maltooligosaccharide transport system permease protein
VPTVNILFKGKFALITKLILLSGIAAILVLLIESALAKKEYAIALFLAASLAALCYTYLSARTVPMKFFLPGLLLLFAFVVAPIIYTVVMSNFNYKTGNIISKQEAITQIEGLGVQPDANGTTFDIVVGRAPSGEYAILVSDVTNHRYFVSTSTKRTDLLSSQVRLNSAGVAIAAPDFTQIPPAQLAGHEDYSKITYAYADKYFISVQGVDVGAVFRQSLRYSASNDTFQNLLDGKMYKDNGRGNYANVSASGDVLQPGWRAPNWFSNYGKLFGDPRVRGPLFKVFIWTVVFAASTVLTSFAFGLLMALTLNRPLRGRRFYRSILVLPFAIPSVMSILIWGGMFDTEFGAINNILGTHIAWFQNATYARLAVILVNLWLAFPYFYLISAGALQAIPSDLLEAAAIDGANPRQIFRKITLPLLMQILTPLLIASFAFNFNNFNLIYLLTGGGPKDQLGGQIAGATDILISYTYQIAFGSNTQDLGLASAISVIIFFIVAGISLYGLRRSKVLETFG